MKNATQNISSVFLTVFLLLTAPPSHAADDKDNRKYKDISSYFLENINSQQAIEAFVFETLRPIRQYGANHRVLTKEDILAKQMWQQTAATSYQVQRILLVDADADGKVTKDEATNFFRYQSSFANDAALARSVEDFMRADINLDSIIDYDEMRNKTLQNSSIENNVLSKLEALRVAIAGPNGSLTVSEVEVQARKAFSTIDTDNDGFLSGDEVAEMRKQTAHKTPYFTSRADAPQCNMPKPADNDIISVFSAYDGASFSTVSLDGQDEETFAAHVKIEKGDKPVYLVLSSFSPMIWQIDGAKDRISRVVLLTERATGAKQTAAGVTGIAKEKVSFVPPNSCFRFFTKIESIETAKARGAILRALGREPDSLGATYNASSLSLPSGKIEPVSAEEARKLVEPPEGFEKFAWREALQHRPAGIDNIKLENVVAQAQAEPYVVLPQEAGIAQLLKQGVLERISSRDYKIVKPLSRYPAGLAGGHAVRFLLGKGLPKPEGDSGHCCVISEETGQSIGTIAETCH